MIRGLIVELEKLLLDGRLKAGNQWEIFFVLAECKSSLRYPWPYAEVRVAHFLMTRYSKSSLVPAASPEISER